VAYIRTKNPATARIGFHSTVRNETHIINSTEWGNIWVYGLDILLTGFLTRAEFNQHASSIHEGARVFQYDRTRTKNLAVPVSDLRPLNELYERVKEYHSKR
jgi:hypothetical protein